jgi:uncharacterized membrane protein YoaK (UPF0700 family)
VIKGELDVDLFEIAQFFLPTIQFMVNFIIGSQTARTSCSPRPNFVNNVSLLMLIIALFTLAFCDGHVNDFYTE